MLVKATRKKQLHNPPKYAKIRKGSTYPERLQHTHTKDKMDMSFLF